MSPAKKRKLKVKLEETQVHEFRDVHCLCWIHIIIQLCSMITEFNNCNNFSIKLNKNQCRYDQVQHQDDCNDLFLKKSFEVVNINNLRFLMIFLF